LASSQRQVQRRQELRVALVGYTNAGKSSLMRALTGSEVLVEDRLFATLGTTVRVMQPDESPRILVTDTVGFVRKLPHVLVAPFRTTLQEAAEAHLLLLVVDASDPEHALQLAVTRQTLAEVAAGVPAWVVFNKVDRLTSEVRNTLAAAFPDALQTSALDPGATTALAARVRSALADAFTQEETFTIPYSRPELLARMHETGLVQDSQFSDLGTTVRMRASPHELARLRGLLK
jgi:GTP-binding protein HflX